MIHHLNNFMKLRNIDTGKEDERTPVDKSLILEKTNNLINTENNRICITRPRLFGKSHSVCEFLFKYCSKKEKNKALFKKMLISQTPNWKKYLNKFNVIHVDVRWIYWPIFPCGDLKFEKRFKYSLVKEFLKEFPKVSFKENTDIIEAVNSVYEQTGEQFIFLIDEYDEVIKYSEFDGELPEYIDFLDSLFNKEKLNNAIALVCMTGVWPIMKDISDTKLQYFEEDSMVKSGIFADSIGFTEDEVKSLCEEKNFDFNKIKAWYGGYFLNNIEIFNPHSVYESLTNGDICEIPPTSSYDNVQDYVKNDYENIQKDIFAMLFGKSIDVGSFEYNVNFKSKNEIFIYLSHIGFLSYKDNKCSIANLQMRNKWYKIIQEFSNNKRESNSLTYFYDNKTKLFNSIIEKDSEYITDFFDEIMLNYGMSKDFSLDNLSSLKAFHFYFEIYNFQKEAIHKDNNIVIDLFHESKKVPSIILAIILTIAPATTNVDFNNIIKEKIESKEDVNKNNAFVVIVTFNPETSKHTCEIHNYFELYNN